jgi:two-component system, cell cycle sensor histidine kinase and response regulator CckA
VDGRILECNEAFARIFGYSSRREMLDDSAVSLYERPEERTAFVEKLRNKGALLEHEHRYRRRDGKPVWTLEYVTYRPGDPPVLEGTIVDMTKRKEAEVALGQARQRYRTILDTSRDGLLFFDLATRRILETNPALQRMLGYTAEELSALTLYDVGLDHRATVDESIQRLADLGALTLEDGVYRRKDGTRLAVAIDAVLVEEDGRKVVFNAVRNLSEKQVLEAQLRQAQKMEAVGRLAGGVAHDFNNLLTAILGYSDLVLTGDAPEDVRQNVEEVRKAAERAAALTGQLLAFSRKQVQQPRVLLLNDVVKNLDPMLHRVLRENVKISFEPEDSLWRVRADPGQIEQILMNLAVNASDAMPEGGRLTIRTRNATIGFGEIPGIPVEPGSYVLLEVSDTGHGMDAETLSHAFEPFFTTKERGKGTGLGLAMVYGIVKQSAGYVQVLSEPGRGATFRIYLPRVFNPADTMSAVMPRPAAARGSETILLVEDEESVRRLTQAVLVARGYKVLVSESAEAALELSRAYKEPIQLLLTDVVLPGMDGHRLAEILRVERPDLAVLLASGYFDTSEGVDKSEQLLRKPFTPEALFDKVRSTLRKARRQTS